MTAKAKLFQNGGSQAVRLPGGYRFPEGQREVSVKRIGRKIVLEPLDEWPETFTRCLGGWREAIERPDQKLVAAQRDPFES